MIIRSPRPESHFSIIANSIIRDSRLSYKARGILIEILSRPDNWRINAKDLAGISVHDKRTSILAGLEELRDAGYLVTTKRQNEDGKWTTDSIVYDIPQGVADVENQHQTVLTEVRFSDLGDERKPKSGFPKSENPTSLEELIKKNHKEELNTYSEEVIQLGQYFADKIEALGAKRPLVTQTWLADIDRMIRIDGREPQQIKKAIDWVHEDPFWSTNILSPAKLRKQYEQLRLKAMQSGKKKPTGISAALQVINEENEREEQMQAPIKQGALM